MYPPRRHNHYTKNKNNSQKARYIEHLEHIIEDEKQLFYDLSNYTTHNPPTCTRHPRWIIFGCIIFSAMLSSTLLMTKNWRSSNSIRRSGVGETERDWRWPEMNPWMAIALAEKEDSEDTSSLLQQQQQQGRGHTQESNAQTSPGDQRIKTWDLNDPALALGKFLDSPDWKTQSLIPGADFINLLRVLRPVDHAFFITLFVNQSPGRMVAARENEKGMSPKTETKVASTIPIHGQHGCGTWIQDFIEYQNGILDETLVARYTVHACSSASSHQQQAQEEEEEEEEEEENEGQEQPCGDVFSQMIAMTSAFAWSVKESRGFFLRADQIHHLQDSFQSPVLQQDWSFPTLSHRRAVDTVKINTEEMTTHELGVLFGLQDALFTRIDDKHGDRVQDRLWALRSRSSNRASFERILSAPNDPIIHPYQSPAQFDRANQQRTGKATSPFKMNKLKNDLESDAVELVLQQDLLSLFINTNHTLDQFIDLGLPLPDRILEAHQARRQSTQQQPTTSTPKASIRAPSAHGSLFSSPSLSNTGSSSASNHALTTAFLAAIHDSHDTSRLQASPKTFGCLLDILLQPQLDLQHLIHPYATLFKLPAVFSIGIFIKPFSSSSTASYSSSSSSSSSSWKSMSLDRQRTVDRYLTCARQIAREFAPKRKAQKVVYVVVSEDAGMARVMESQEEWDEEVITPSWTPHKDRLHRHHNSSRQQQPPQPHPSGNDPSAASTEPTPGAAQITLTKQQQQILENWVLSKTDYQVVSDQSDFAKVAVWRTRREGRSVVIRENPALEQFMTNSNRGGDGQEEEGYVGMLDCGTLLNNLVYRD